MKWMWLAVWVCACLLYTFEEIRIADLELRCKEAEEWTEVVAAEAQEWLERAGR